MIVIFRMMTLVSVDSSHREITKRLRNTMGWSATSGEVDNFIYEDANETFM